MSAGLMRRTIWKNIWIFWILVIIAATTAPWNNFQMHPTNWQRINWAPYAHTALRMGSMKDVLQNILLYIPFGFCYVKRFPIENRSLLLSVGMFASALSISTEVAQVFQPLRFPSATDVINNIFGALLGANFGRWSSRQKNPLG